jgi:hypothetical protein
VAVLGQQHGQPDALALTAGQAVDQALGIGQAQGLGDFFMIFLAEAPQQAVSGVTTEADQLTHRQAGSRRQLLRQVRQLTGKGAFLPGGQRFAIQAQAAMARSLLAGQQLQQGGFAGTLMPYQTGRGRCSG